MSKLPAEQVRIGQGVEDVEVVYHGVCTMPLCTEVQVEHHHIVRRSHLGGAYDGVEIDDQVQTNIAELCREHHRQITDNEAQIMFEAGRWWWSEPKEKDLLMRPQPGLVLPKEGVLLRPAVEWPGPLEKFRVDANLEQCPRCKGKGRVPAKDQVAEKKRKYRTWSMGIPVDAGENGYEIWVEHLEQCSQKIQPLLGYSETVPPYYVLIAVTRDWLNTP